jgi:hypothetical protein
MLRPPTSLLVDPDQRTTIMAWTTDDRRRYVPTMQEMARQGMLAIDHET